MPENLFSSKYKPVPVVLLLGRGLCKCRSSHPTFDVIVSMLAHRLMLHDSGQKAYKYSRRKVLILHQTWREADMMLLGISVHLMLRKEKKKRKNKGFYADGFLQMDFLTALLPWLNLL